jgi:phosphopantothenoylcysteine synthetase/decarboxylase
MDQQFEIPEEYEIPIRRVLPHLSAALQNDPKVLQALVLYLKLGGEKMARIVIDALNVTHKIQYAEMLKKMREEAMLRGQDDDDDASDDDDDEGEDDDEDEDEESEGDDDDDDDDS